MEETECYRLEKIVKLIKWTAIIWMVFIFILLSFMAIRHFLLLQWLGQSFSDPFIIILLLALIIAGSRFAVMKLQLQSNLKSLILVIIIWMILSVISDISLHQILSREDWKTYFGSSLIAQTDFWILFIFCELVGPLLVIWLLRSRAS